MNGIKSVELASRALIKCDRAGDLFEELERRVGQWNRAHQVMAPSRSPHDGPPRLEMFRPNLVESPPLEQWESIFHDGVHNLRVALDNFCADLCHLEGKPAKAARMYFPIVQHPNDWPTKAEGLTSMPAQVLERIRECQAWARSTGSSPDPLTFISSIDNADKRKGFGVSMDTLPLPQSHTREMARLPPELENAVEWPLVPWVRITLTPPPDRGTGMMIPIDLYPTVQFNGKQAPVADVQRWLHSEVRRTIQFIASGAWPPVSNTVKFFEQPNPHLPTL